MKNNNKILVCCAVLEISYLALSFTLAEVYGQWSFLGELFRTLLRVISIVFYSYFYQKYFLVEGQTFNAKAILTPSFCATVSAFLVFAIFYTNAENETLWWQFVFVISGFAAGLREELFYRGIIQKTLQTKFDYKIGLVMATMLFTVSHLQYIYHGQTYGLILIAIAGIIFGSIFIYTGSVALTAVVHGVYDALLSVNLTTVRISNGAAMPILGLLMLAFLVLISKKLYVPQSVGNRDNTNSDNLSMS